MVAGGKVNLDVVLGRFKFLIVSKIIRKIKTNNELFLTKLILVLTMWKITVDTWNFH